MDNPCVELDVLNVRDGSILGFLFDKIFHLFESCVFNVVSAFVVQNLACKKSPKDLEHQICIVILFIHNDFFETVQELFGICIKINIFLAC